LLGLYLGSALAAMLMIGLIYGQAPISRFSNVAVDGAVSLAGSVRFAGGLPGL
jgi:hypothetical protein